MSEKVTSAVKHTKAYRKTDEYALVARRFRKATFKMVISLLAVFAPFAYFTAAYLAENHFYPKWSIDIGFFIFILGLAVAAVIIPILFKLFCCPFTYWKLFTCIAVSLAFGYLASLLVFHFMKLDDNMLMSEIIFALQTVVCTVYAVIGVNRNMWEYLNRRGKKKEFVQAYKRYETAVQSDPVDILTVYAISQSDYGFAKDYMKNNDALDLLYFTAKQNAVCGKISRNECRIIITTVAAGGICEAAEECARYYIDLDESELIKLSVDEKSDAISILKTLEKFAEDDKDIEKLHTVFKSRLHSSMIIYEPNDEKYVEQLLENSSALKKLIKSTSGDDDIVKAAQKALECTESTINITLRNKK